MFYNLLTEKIILPLSDVILNTSLWKTFNLWKQLEKKSRNELDDIQLKALERILRHASQKVPYYKNIAYEEDIKSYLAKFPILTKQILKKEDLLAVSKEKLVKRSSSGSSGVQSTVYMSKNEVSTIVAIQALWWSWSGFRFGDKVLQMGINTKRGVVKTLKDSLLRFKYVDAFSLSEQDILALLHELRRHPRKRFLGYASSLYSIAKTAEKYNIDDIRFDSVMSLGDKMYDHYRKTIEKQFGTKVYDTYGCSEGLMMAGECEAGKYHIMSPHVYMEIVDDNDKEVAIGEIGHVVVTRLDSYAMPLIRYKLGDLAIKGDPNEKCSCGRAFPILEKVIGRETDLLHLPSGKFVIAPSFCGIFEYFPQIKQFQVIELEDGIMVRYIKEESFTDEVLRRVKQEIHDQIDDQLKVFFKEEMYIEPTASGKPCLVMSKERAKTYLKSKVEA